MKSRITAFLIYKIFLEQNMDEIYKGFENFKMARQIS
jgi:hypothetical protein